MKIRRIFPTGSRGSKAINILNIRLTFAAGLIFLTVALCSPSPAADKYANITLEKTAKACEKCRSGKQGECANLQLILTQSTDLNVAWRAADCLAECLKDQKALAKAASSKITYSDKPGEDNLTTEHFGRLVVKVTDPALLKDIAKNAYYYAIRVRALRQLKDEAFSEAVALSGDATQVRWGALSTLSDARLSTLAGNSQDSEFTFAALRSIRSRDVRKSLAESGLALNDVIYLPIVQGGRDEATYIIEESPSPERGKFVFKVGAEYVGDSPEKVQFKPSFYAIGAEHRFAGHVFIPLVNEDAEYAFDVKRELSRSGEIGFSFSGGSLTPLSIYVFNATVASTLKENAKALEVTASPKDPLILNVTDQGYKYLKGSGTVKLPSGKVYTFGKP
jgi:hypothetical protein